MIDLEKYDYDLPEELIRKEGVEPRDSSRLLAYETTTDTVTHTRFSELAKFLPEQSLMVLNATKVVPARLWLRKPTESARNASRSGREVGGGKIEVFVLVNEMASVIPDSIGDPGCIETEHENAIEPGSRIKCGMTNFEIPILVDRKCEVGWKLSFPNDDYFEVIRQEENKFFARLQSKKSLGELLEQYGETPIPHYLESELKNEQALRKRYQTIFAHAGASVAAPTASLHFTQNVFDSLDVKNITRIEVNLNVGLGTFAPLRAENFISGKLHREYISVSGETANMMNNAKQSGCGIVAVGTTALRTIESVAQRGNGEMIAYTGETDIFIYPPYRFQMADSLVTNFHLPKSSLMLLVEAFLQHKKAKRGVIELYHEAIQEGYAFYSFGDSMLII